MRTFDVCFGNTVETSAGVSWIMKIEAETEAEARRIFRQRIKSRSVKVEPWDGEYTDDHCDESEMRREAASEVAKGIATEFWIEPSSDEAEEKDIPIVYEDDPKQGRLIG